MKATKKAKSATGTKWIIGVVVLVGMAGVLAFTVNGPTHQNTGPSVAPAAVPTASAAQGTAGTASAAPLGGASGAAMQQAASANKYLFAFIYETNNESTLTIRKSFESSVGKLADKAQWTAVNRTDPAEKAFVVKYGLDRAPMPLVLAVAPNGAITGGFPGQTLTEEQLRGAFASPGLQACLKGVQGGRLVFVCVQNKATKSNEAAMKGVNDFKADAQYGGVTEIVKLDPSDPAEVKFLGQLQIDPKVDEATTAFVAPPGAVFAKYKGPTDKNTLTVALQKAIASCAPGSGCCPTAAPAK